MSGTTEAFVHVRSVALFQSRPPTPTLVVEPVDSGREERPGRDRVTAPATMNGVESGGAGFESRRGSMS